MTRIRYKNVGNSLISNEVLCGNELTQVELNGQNLSYSISNNKGVVKTGSANNLQTLKRLAKLALIELGANFSNEIRNRNKKLVIDEKQA